MLTTLAVALMAAGFVLVRWTWFGLVLALAGALILPLPPWWVAAIHSAAH